VAETGLLRVAEALAALSMTAAGVGGTVTLLATPAAGRSLEASVRMRKGFIRSIVAEEPEAPGAGIVGGRRRLAPAPFTR